MRKTIFSLLLALAFAASCAGTQGIGGEIKRNNNSILVAYFSRAGNIDLSSGVDATSSASVNLLNGKYVGNAELIAQWIQEEVGGDLFLIQTEEPYSADYDETVERGENENRNDIHPALISRVTNMEDYNIVFLGYPIWAYDIPVALYSFLEEYDLSGKTIIPFCTSGATSISGTIETIKRMEPEAKVLEGITVNHNQVLGSKTSVISWLKRIGIVK
jgi:flavodoxin